MESSSQLQRIVQRLPLVYESTHFILRFGLRNPPIGKGLGRGGVRDLALVQEYGEALERLYSTMTTPPLSRKPPCVGPAGKTAVYVFDIAELFLDGSPFPFTDVDLQDIPYIGLPCRSDEPTTPAELQRAAAAAVHEATHVFNFRERPLRDRLIYEVWSWFDEATCVFMETLVLPNNPDSLRFAMDWADHPEVPLDHWSAQYQAGLFVRYLAERMGPGFISRVWMESATSEKPLEALTRLSREQGQEFSSPDPDIVDIFASGYCMDSYFPWQGEGTNFAPDVYARYGERAVTESFELQAGDQKTSTDSLDHLSCRYYRFYVQEGVTTLQIQLQPLPPTQSTPLKAEIAIVTKARQRGCVQRLQLLSSPTAQCSGEMFTELLELDIHNIDHLVLVVSNCGLRSAQDNTHIEHDDRQEYRLEVLAR